MANLTTILATAERTLGVLKMLEPILSDTPYVSDVLGVIARVLDGARTGKVAYETLVTELEELNVEMEAIRARGEVTGDDIRDEVSAIKQRGERIDALLARLDAE